MNVTHPLEITSKTLQPLTSASPIKGSDTEDMFSSIFQSAVNSINTTNGYLSKAENEEIKLALGETDNTHDLAIALQNCSILWLLEISFWKHTKNL